MGLPAARAHTQLMRRACEVCFSNLIPVDRVKCSECDPFTQPAKRKPANARSEDTQPIPMTRAVEYAT
jgi:hypothetical protein